MGKVKIEQTLRGLFTIHHAFLASFLYQPDPSSGQATEAGTGAGVPAEYLTGDPAGTVLRSFTTVF